jgi:hypothetical protein
MKVDRRLMLGSLLVTGACLLVVLAVLGLMALTRPLP